MRSISLATKFSLAIAILVTVAVGIMSLLAVTVSHRSVREQILSANLTTATLAARAVEQYIADAASIMREAPGRPKLRQEILNANWPEAQKVLENFLRHFTQFDYVFVQDPQGIIRVRVPHAETVGQDFSFRDFFQEAMRTRRLYVSGVYVSKAARRPVVSIAVPVLDSGDTVKGVLVGALSLKTMSQFIAMIRQEDRSLMYLVDSKGLLIAHSGGATAQPADDMRAQPIVQAVMAGGSGTMEFREPGGDEPFLGAYIPVASVGWGVVAAKPVSTAYAPATRLGQWLLWIALGCTAAAVLLGWGLARTLTGPLLRVAAATEKLAAGDFAVRVTPESRDEVAALATSFNHMAEQLQKSYQKLQQKTNEVEALNRQLKDQLEELQRTQAHLVQSEKLAAMGSLLAGVAHELNNPLGVVLGQAALLRHAAGSGPLAERAEEIARAAKRCARIVQNFLALARQRPLERQRVLLNQVIEEAAELVAYPLRVNNVEVQLDLDPDLPVLWADPHQLHQVVVNLLANAQQAMEKSPPPRRITLTARHDSEQERVRLEVADTGPGVPPEIQSRIFEPFFTTKLPGQGTGLGLSLCHGIIASHRGTIRVESPPGQGAVFVIELPVEAPPETAQEVQVAETLQPIREKTILVVDDEPGIAHTLAEMLALDGHQVETAPNGVLALEKLGERAYDLILSDLKMPELDGPGLYLEVARRHPALCRRFIFLTGDTLGSETAAFLEQSRAPSLTKPFELEEVRQAVRRILGEA